MPWTTLVCVTVLFSVICGNRLMDNHFMRSSSTSLTHDRPYKLSQKDEFLNIMPSKLKEDPENPSSLEELFYDKSAQLLPRRICKEKWFDFLSPQQTYVNCEKLAKKLVAADEERNVEVMNPFQQLQLFGDTKSQKDQDEDLESDGDESEEMLAPAISVLPIAKFKDFYHDLVVDSEKEGIRKRNGNAIGTPLGTPPTRGCDCKVKNDLVDLGQQHFPRYLLNAVCQANDLGSKCWSGSLCRPLEYKVKVLTFRPTTKDNTQQKDLTLAWLPDDLRQIWKFKTVTVTAGCFCS
uniref:Prothoracicotropic hormone n=1 Tax=Stomoxys calcitrans TaxID=35570 RepID=A0A1I8PJS7_STOCA